MNISSTSNNKDNTSSKYIDNQMFINCSFDIDYLEVNKIEPLKRYEENLYLLGKIFSSEVSKGNIDENKKEDCQNEETTSKDYISQINELIYGSLKEKDFKKEKVTSILNELLNDTNSLNDVELLIIDQIEQSLKEYEDTERLIKENKEDILKEKNNINTILNKCKVNKYGSSCDIDALVEELDSNGLSSRYIESMLNKRKLEVGNSDQITKKQVKKEKSAYLLTQL